MDSKLGARKWIAFLLAGFVGQLAWAIENNYLNLYVFHCTSEYGFIPVMTALSAVAATITTLLMGALSDRVGKRKIFISLGYIIWGISIILFAFLDPKNNITLVNNSIFLAGTLIVIMDCVMTFFGSTANDAAFNASVTENTNINNRGKVESVLSVLPLFAMIAVVLVGGIFVDGKEKHWDIFFYIFGGITSLVGIICLFLYPKDVAKPNKEEPYIKNIFYGFRPKVIKDNKLLYLTLIAFMVFNIGIQVYMPYFMVYIQEGLGIKEDNFTVTLGVVLVVASIAAIVTGLFMDKIGKNKLLIPGLLIAVTGGVLMTFMKEKVGVMICGTVLMSGYLVCTAILGAKVRDYTPTNEAGLFQGVRMIFVVLVPMVTGPYIGQAVSYINAQTYINEYGKEVTKPNEYIFLFTAIVLALVIIPVIILMKKEKENAATSK
ncbi:MAG: MFS transporter [Bacilli bacterium]|nr:MFS transporter [Bacilli bacterium]